MRRQPATIICDAARWRAPQPASSQAGDWHDVTGHHRYYGSSAINGGERIVEDRRAPALRQSLRFLIAHSGRRRMSAIASRRRSFHQGSFSTPPTKKRGGMAPAAPQLLCSLVQG